MEICDSKVSAANNANNPSSGDSVLSLKNVVFTLHDGKLLVTPKELHDCSNASDSPKTRFALELEAIHSPSEEIHIEIIRENTIKSDQKESGEINIHNISSAYEAFWKSDFEKCIERRSCTKCGKVLLTPLCLLHHWHHIHENPHPSECFICHKRFTDEGETKNHIREIHCISHPECICEVCFEVCSDESDKIIHRALHSRNISCKWCQERFPCEFLLNIHNQECLHQKLDLNCHVCGCHFQSSHMLQLHHFRHRRKICDICQCSFLGKPNVSSEETEVELIRHLKTSHSQEEVENILRALKKQDEEEETLDKLFINHEPISKIFDSKLVHQLPQIDMHSSITEMENFSNSIDKQLEVSKCPTNERIQDQLDGNINISVTSLHCAECLKAFDSKEELLNHDLEHQMPFSCHICEEKFHHRRRFKKHMRSHGIIVKPGVIRYKCKQCSVCCGTLSGLRTHILTHTNQKPHLCDRCGLTFRRPQALRVHKTTVHSTRALHTCSLCGSGSLSKPSLLRHVQCVHGGVRRFICGHCGTRFLQNQDLRKHLKRVHNYDFPPMDRVSKKSNKEIHVIPSVKDVNPTDPLAEVIKSAIREEESKLEALCQNSRKLNVDKGSDQCLTSDNCTDGILLNILGDVASKAAPLEHSNASEILKPVIHEELQVPTKFLCAGCQYVSGTLDDFSAHLAQCNHEKCIETLEKKDSNSFPSGKAACYFTMGSSFLSSASSLANPFCIISSQNNGSAFQIGPSVISNHENNFLCSVMNLGASIPQPQALTFPLSMGSVYCSNTIINESCIKTSKQIDLDNAPLKVYSNITHEESLNLSQVEFPNRSHSLNVTSQEISAAQGDTETFKLKDASSLGMSLANASLINTEDLNQSKSNPQKNIDTSVENPPLEFSMNPQPSKSHADEAKIIILPADEEMMTNSSVNSRETNASTQPLIDIAECVVPSVPETISIAITDDKSLPAQTTGKADFWPHSLRVETSCSSNLLSVPNTSSIHISGSKCDDTSVSRRDVASIKPMKIGQNVCPECGKKLSCASNFKRHLKVHFGEKAHECLYCGKSFRYKCNLTVHIRSHTGARPYECLECKKKFRYQTELKEHKQSHESSGTLSCEECGQRFIRQRDLRRHSLTHSTKRPTCHICQKPFSRLDYLKLHIKSHRKLEEMSLEGIEQQTRYEENVSKKYYGKKTRHQKETSLGCSFCSLSFRSIKEKKTHQEICERSVKKVSDNIQDPSTRTSVLSDLNDNNSSEDLISLAYQAAEDGVEFMFVEESSCVVNDAETEEGDQNIESNLLYVQVLDHNEYDMLEASV